MAIKNIRLAKRIQSNERRLERRRRTALKRNVKRRKSSYTTARDMELMFGY